MNISKPNTVTIIVVLAFVFFTFGIILSAMHPYDVLGSITADQATQFNKYRTYDLFASTTAETTIATSTSATSTNITAYNDSSGRVVNGSVDIRGAKKATLFFTRGGSFAAANTGTTTFKIQVTPDGTSWYDFSKLVQSTSTSISNAVVQSIATIGATAPGNAATSTLIFGMDLSSESYYALRCIVVIFVDGASSCAAAITY